MNSSNSVGVASPRRQRKRRLVNSSSEEEEYSSLNPPHNIMKISDLFKGSLTICLLIVSILGRQVFSSDSTKDFEYTTTWIDRDLSIGPCSIETNRKCPDSDISFYLFNNASADVLGEEIFVNETSSNLAGTSFQRDWPTKIIVHGYNADMNLDALVDIRKEYLLKGPHNIIALNWPKLSAGPCYFVVAHLVPHVGQCLAQLIHRLRDFGATDIHPIGFSLGAHVPAYAANNLRPYKLPRITGLDPAMPLFVTEDPDKKLDSSDAEFVDIYHTNALMQGKIEKCGHVDFYMNGGIIQPGCLKESNPLQCNHVRAPKYFAESINSKVGFWGWRCNNLFKYFIGLCPPRLPAIIAGDSVDKNTRGSFIVKTKDSSPFAMGIFSNEPRNSLDDSL